MKNILIISPHFPPSNLTAVHRARLFANHLPEFGWNPIILMVHEKHYEEKLDENLLNLLPKDLRMEKVGAMRLTKPRLIGDIGLRAFYSMYQKAKAIIQKEKIDFLYITIPSFYGALWGRWLHEKTGIPYGIDYIDPWVHDFPGSNQFLSRHWMATKVANKLEPIAVKKASLITGVAEGYFTPVFDRNPHLKNKCRSLAMPYGGESADHEALAHLKLPPYLFQKDSGKINMVYAGAMLPKAYGPLEEMFKAIAQKKELYLDVAFHFIGTGRSTDDAQSGTIRPLAEKYGLWQEVIFEHPKRIPYLDVLLHLDAADGVFILGSTEPHYTPSKIYQGVLSGKPILALLHSQSTGVEVIQNSRSGVVLSFAGEAELDRIEKEFNNYWEQFLQFKRDFKKEQIDLRFFEQYSARYLTRQLANELDQIVSSVD